MRWICLYYEPPVELSVPTYDSYRMDETTRRNIRSSEQQEIAKRQTMQIPTAKSVIKHLIIGFRKPI